MSTSDTPLRLAFYRGRDHGAWLDRLVARHDRGPHSHVEIAFPNGLCAGSSWRDGGVRFRRVDLDDGHWDALPVPASPRDVTTVRAWCARRVGGRYDVPGVLAFKLPIVRERLGWWFCSEFVAAALQRMGHLPAVRPASLSPNGLFRLWREELETWGRHNPSAWPASAGRTTGGCHRSCGPLKRATPTEALAFAAGTQSRKEADAWGL